MTLQTIQVLNLMRHDADVEWYGLQIANAAGLKSGSVYVVLARLEQAEWLTSRWEEIDPVAEGRPRRRLYKLTGEGLRAATAAVEEQVAILTGTRGRHAASPLRPGVANP